MEIVMSVIFGLCGITIGLCLIKWLFTGAEYLSKCASELGFIGEIFYFLAWIFFFPLMFFVSLVCGFLFQYSSFDRTN